ncbi:PfkB family carbohydrate kinase [Roseateles sp. SL47]|uniref:PfkB family carbohydrate kinase n=1 Tax=Roseateles sp. SL47 TaxID=2995138 RepID=UPI0022713200|nr:PfkB family carbohydrate kinase [Roseateles sp. SL47]WAC75626.1 PfkB family carbohydrate kinase [Roseateles sp. SL47]
MTFAPTPVLHADLANFVCFGEALTEMRRVGPSEWRSYCGGSPWKVAIATARLGQLGAFAGGISKDAFGQELWQCSVDAALDLRFIQQFARAPLMAFLHDPVPPSYLYVGDDSADLHFRPHALPAGWRHALRWAHFGSISLTREPLAARLVALAESLKDDGVRISYDPLYRLSMDSRYDRTLERMCKIADVIQVSEDDLCGLFRCRDYHLGLGQLAAWNPKAVVLLTLRERGAQLFHPKGDVSATGPKLPPPTDPGGLVDWMDAGDATTAGLLFSLMRTPDGEPEEHLRWAMATGAAASDGQGVHGLTYRRVEDLLEQVQVARAELA